MRPFCMLYPISHELWCFPVWLVGIGTICGTEWAPYWWFFTWSSIVFSNACAGKLSVEYFRGHLWTFGGVLSFWEVFSSLVLCSVISSSLGLSLNFISPTPSSICSTQRSLLSAGVLLLHYSLKTLSRNWTGIIVEVTLLCFPSLRDHCPSLSNA